MFKVGKDLSWLPKMNNYSSEDDLLFGLPKIVWIASGIVTSFVVAQTYHMLS